MADDIPNRVTVALVDAKVGEVKAKVEGLADLIKLENAATRDAIGDLKGLPVEVATLRADLSALDEREQKADEAIHGRVSNLESSHARAVTWRVTTGISLMAAMVGGLIGHVHIPFP